MRVIGITAVSIVISAFGLTTAQDAFPVLKGPYVGQKTPGDTPESIHFDLTDPSDVFVHPYIAPDESFLIYCSSISGTHGKADLWISFPLKKGDWSKPKNLGHSINTSDSEGFPSLFHDGKYLFFERNGDIYWVETNILKEFKPEHMKAK